MGNDFKREATQAEIEQMKALLETDLKNGSLGLGTGLEYDPGIYSSTSEVLELAKITSTYGGRYISHMRSEDIYLNQSIDEILTIGREADIPVQISHFKLARKGLWGKSPEILRKLDSARTTGIAVSADIYPYQYWQSSMTVLFPERNFESRETAEFALTELTTPEGMIISTFDAKPEYENLTLAEIAKLRNEDPVTTYIELIKISQKQPGERIIAKSMDLEDIKSILNWPFTNLCSDGSPDGHPRGWGSYPKYLNMDTGQSLEAKINKMTLKAAQNLNLNKIGQIKEGYYADLVLFNLDSIKDKATFENSTLKSEGINFVFVSGEIAYANQMLTKVYSGRIIKRIN
ncbi:N-acyl-D-amino-acid deacylase family protein [Maribacter antarcticus]|uniref:N-acyl-D-amino-acid deacylase family protein n=1 Tax=Maribacter antarcticus TaxID=505250 RepID=UPI000AE654D5|nr:amidohydrolase family protein [Maribacter antarcticus]